MSEYKFICQWLMKEPNIDLIKPYANEVRHRLSATEVADLRAKFIYKAENGHESYVSWAFTEEAKKVGFDAREVYDS